MSKPVQSLAFRGRGEYRQRAVAESAQESVEESLPELGSVAKGNGAQQ